ncbi:hypothetical protein X975_16734, partial [Stegodyphus mimosarum]
MTIIYKISMNIVHQPYFYFLLGRFLFIFLALATVSIAKRPQTIPFEKFDAFNHNFFRIFCHFSVICVVYNKLKNSPRQKMELTYEHFRAIIFHRFRRGLSRQECFDELNSLYSTILRHCNKLV